MIKSKGCGEQMAKDIETKNLLISLSEVDTTTGGSNLNRLIKTIMNTDQLIYPKEDGIHGQFKSLIYHCTLWEKTTWLVGRCFARHVLVLCLLLVFILSRVCFVSLVL